MTTAHSVAEIGQAAWDVVSGDTPFQSFRWMSFGESVLADNPPIYLTIEEQPGLPARGTFYRVHDEPLPLPRLLRTLLGLVFRRFPLFICRAPFSSTSGMVLPSGGTQESARRLLVANAREEAVRQKASFLLFDYLDTQEVNAPAWPGDSLSLTITGPGHILHLPWESFEAFLAAAGKKGRQHYHRCNEQAKQLGIRVTRHDTVSDIDEALALVHGLEQRHRSPHTPWTRRLLEHMSMVESTFLEARIDNRLVGCGLLLYDQGVQLATALGLAHNIPYVYFALIYEGIRAALEAHACCLRWGSGAESVKHQLGFTTEDNNHARVLLIQPFLRPFLNLAGKRN